MSSQFSVYPIVDGCSREAVFHGTLKNCISFGKKNLKPHSKDYIILQDGW